MSWANIVAPKIPVTSDADVKIGLPRTLPVGVGLGSVFQTDDGERWRLVGFQMRGRSIVMAWLAESGMRAHP